MNFRGGEFSTGEMRNFHPALTKEASLGFGYPAASFGSSIAGCGMHRCDRRHISFDRDKCTCGPS